MIFRKIKNRIRLLRTRIQQKLAAISAAAQLKDLAASVENPFFVIVMPGSLHILKIFMRYAPDTVKFVFILNGITEWEKVWVESRFPGFQTVILHSIFSHGRVIDLLIDHYKKPFGLIDSDCFVFNSDYFKTAQDLQDGTLLNAFFSLKNEEIDIEIPQTYFLFFNPMVISRIKKKYHVNCDQYQYQGLPKQIKEKLSTIGIDKIHMPESFKKLFDTLRLVVVLGLIEGFKVNFVEKYPGFSQPSSEIYHVGAVYFNNNIKRLSLMRGSYFWRACLERCGDPDLIEHYHAAYGNQTSSEILNSNHEFASYSSTRKFVEYVDHILDNNPDYHQIILEDRLV